MKWQADDDSSVVKKNQKINAKSSIEALKAERDAILAELYGVRANYALAA